jgi:general secretion pathway protein G
MNSRAVRPLRRAAFSLVEMLIVIVMIAIIAGVVVMQIGSTGEEAALSTLFTNEQMLQTAIDRYKIDHGGQGPDEVEAESLPQLVQKTNSQGTRGSGPAHVYGPYLANDVPLNPLTGTRRIVTTTESPPSDLSDPTAGWVYNPTTGQIWGIHGMATDSKEKLARKIGG